MGSYREIYGDIIQQIKTGEYDVACQGCNCFNLQKAGIAVAFVKNFGTDKFSKEAKNYYGDINKLGTIDYALRDHTIIVNCYSQFHPGRDGSYEALTLCMRKINHIFGGKKIILPLLGCGIANLVWDWEQLPIMKDIAEFRSTQQRDVKTIIKEELKDMEVTVIHYKK